MKIGPTCPKSETVFIYLPTGIWQLQVLYWSVSFRVPASHVLFVEAWHRQLRSLLLPPHQNAQWPRQFEARREQPWGGGVQFFSGNVAEMLANDQGSWKNQPKQNALLIKGIPQIYLTFEWCLIPPKWVAFNDPWWHHPQAKNTQSSMSEWCILFS